MNSEFKLIENSVCASAGFLASGIHAGIRKNKTKKDLALIYSEVPCVVANVYTTNVVCGSPIVITKKHCENKIAQAIICNSGNANTCNADGEEKAEKMSELLANELNISASDVVVASTGVIGQVLDITPIEKGMKKLVSSLNRNGASDSAEAIMTTDTAKKEIALEFKIGDKVCHMGGIAKGSGMIHPNMATMLVFITTDVMIDKELLQKALSNDIVDTFNMISVDGDTSTNDMVTVLANGKAENDIIKDENSKEFETFKKALNIVTSTLCKKIAGDGEGATKLIECNVSGTATKQEARVLAKSVITSSLFKAAMFGSDANWGRILCAMGYSGVKFDTNAVNVEFTSVSGTIVVCVNGKSVDFDETLAKKVLSENEIKVNITLFAGNEKATAWGCDLTYDYVKINGDYRT